MNTKHIQDEVDNILSLFIEESKTIDEQSVVNRNFKCTGNLMTQAEIVLHEIGGVKIPIRDLKLAHLYGKMEDGQSYPLFVLSFHVMVILSSCVDPAINISGVIQKHIRSVIRSDAVKIAIQNRAKFLTDVICQNSKNNSFELVFHKEFNGLREQISASLEVISCELAAFGKRDNTVGSLIAHSLSLGRIPIAWAGNGVTGSVVTLEAKKFV